MHPAVPRAALSGLLHALQVTHMSDEAREMCSQLDDTTKELTQVCAGVCLPFYLWAL